jgi:hypothetical protein
MPYKCKLKRLECIHAWRLRNKEKIRQKRLAWEASNPDKLKQYQKNRQQKRLIFHGRNHMATDHA